MQKILGKFFSKDKEFVRVASFSILSSLLKLGITIIIGKVIASSTGLVGFVYFGQANNVLAIVYAFLSLGLTNAIIKYTSIYAAEKDHLNEYLGTSVYLVLASNLVLGLPILLFSRTISEFVFASSDYYWFFMMLLVLMPFYSIGQIFISYLNGKKDFNKILKLNLAISLFTGLISIALVWLFGVFGVFFSLAFNLIFYFLIPFVWANSSLNEHSFKPHLSRGKVKVLFSFSLMFIAGASVLPISQFFQRSFLLNHLSELDAGLWESLNRISMLISLLVSSVLSMYLLPKLANLNTRFEISPLIKRIAFYIASASFFGFSIFWLIRDEIVLVLYTKEFLRISDVLHIQFVGDFFRLGSLVFAYLLIAKEKIVYYLSGEIGIGVLLVLLTKLLVIPLGFEGAIYSYSICYFIYFLYLLIVYKRVDWK